jgi:hypothetical protein
MRPHLAIEQHLALRAILWIRVPVGTSSLDAGLRDTKAIEGVAWMVTSAAAPGHQIDVFARRGVSSLYNALECDLTSDFEFKHMTTLPKLQKAVLPILIRTGQKHSPGVALV